MQPSEGFSTLVRICSATPRELGNLHQPVPLDVPLGHAGNTILRVSVERLLGEGSGSVVYEHINDKGESVVIKTSTAHDDPFRLLKWQSQIASEIRILQAIRSEHTPKIHVLQEKVENNTALCTVPLGKPLQLFLDTIKGDTKAIKRALDGVLAALEAAQKAEMCHNDIHTGNVIVVEKDQLHTTSKDKSKGKHRGRARGRGKVSGPKEVEVAVFGGQHKTILIDWGLATKAKTVRTWFTGVALFLSSKIIASNQCGGPCEIDYVDDLESVAYPFSVSSSLRIFYLIPPPVICPFCCMMENFLGVMQKAFLIS